MLRATCLIVAGLAVLTSGDDATFSFVQTMSEEIAASHNPENTPLAPPPPPFSRCNDQQLFGCQYKFNKFLGIEGDADWRNPGVLAYVINRIMLSGRDGFVQVCTARQQFYRCLGPAYFSCMDPLYYLRHGYGTGASYGYLAIMLQLEWMCNGGFQVGMGNYPCLLRAGQQQAPAITQCVQSFNTTIHQDPTMYCSAGQTLVDCVRKPYQTECNYSGESSWWICETIQYGYLMLSCNLKCPITNP